MGTTNQIQIKTEEITAKIKSLNDLVSQLDNLQNKSADAYSIKELAFYSKQNPKSKGPSAENMKLLVTELNSVLEKAKTLITGTTNVIQKAKDDFVEADNQ